MLLRLLFVLLIALNIAVAAWLLLGDSGTPAIDPNDGGVPKLKLLAELPESAATTPAPATSARTGVPAAPEKSTSVALPAMPAKAASAPPVVPPAIAPKPPAMAAAPNAPTSPRRSYRCLAIGPFANQVDLRATRGAIASRTVRSRQRQEQTSESRGWRVFLPAQATREQALAQARRLEAKGIKDYFVVTAQGELQNSVALGLFHDPANARKRRDEVVAAGFPARMSERTETTPVWWLDVVVPEEAGGDIRRGIRTPGVAARTTGCF
ncbi:Sporulation related domain-containing protein [Luteibacter sp. UNC138MFCol5.1]|uniref:SPOR domain-containing protein n=1 Tax=Luteibacter sp. UNC138MFCol5.1 TaxID=1502774 RepID=UPI0008C8D80E|nr:SPOR domain-containing protein [Luteibacter sp. UNC138MFCol5.1]SEP06371.1 Sporulation related domain-containing protein [Luteibacter sp. UNC138MFCol5.1]